MATKNILSGLLVLEDGVRSGSIHFNTESGCIDKVTQSIDSGALPDTHLIFPGFIDLHVHCREDVSGQQTYKEDFLSASMAALNGGITHMADMPNNLVPPIDDKSYLDKNELCKKAKMGITLYGGIGPKTKPLKRNVPYKAYMGPSVGPLFFENAEELDHALSSYRKQNVSFHCEDPEIMQNCQDAASHEARRPIEAEVVSTELAIKLIEKYELSGKLCHFSTKDGLQVVKRARARGLKVGLEVTPHHLFFDESHLNKDNHKLLQMNPPLRSPEDRRSMIEALRDGTIEYLATDHAPHTLDEKEMGMSGVPHLDTYGVFLTWLMDEENFTPEQILSFACIKPGEFLKPYLPKSFGLGIGQLKEGYRADFAVLNLKAPIQISSAMIQSKCAWSPFTGHTFSGSLASVLVAGVNQTQSIKK